MPKRIYPYSIHDLGNSIRIILPSRQRWFLVLQIPLLIWWSISLLTALFMGLSNISFYLLFFSFSPQLPFDLSSESGFFLLWWGILIFTILVNGGLVTIALRSVLWQLAGKEVVEVGEHFISLERHWLLSTHPAKAGLTDIRQPITFALNQNRLRSLLFEGLIQVERKSSHFTFGKDLDGIDAEKLVVTIQKKFPNYRSELERTSPSPKSRCTLDDQGPGLKIVIPAYRQWLMLVSAIPLSFFAFLFTQLVIMSIGQLFRPGILLKSMGANPWFNGSNPWLSFVCGMLPGFVFVGFILAVVYWFLYIALWQLVGREVIEVHPDALIVHYKFLWFGVSKRFPAEHIQALRTLPTYSKGLTIARPPTKWGLSDGTFAFDYELKTFQFGSRVNASEAKHILEIIYQKFPQYQSQLPH